MLFGRSPFPAMSENLELPNSLGSSTDLENEMLRNELSNDRGTRWLVPPGSRAEMGIVCIMQCILRGPCFPNTFNSYATLAMLKLPDGTFGETRLENRRLEPDLTGGAVAVCGGWES
ncbi:hypothetical protein HanHA300_Chr02g0053391 [Helianthus annuus]|nr:hypothetical protein HanHA300_Chr02g0053391 [Helianthus annuus]KAJ0615284.1 hypothetical protein HanIR_Chr02g0072361 [Helianthus annuus]KAJ0618729.1 hypothetical protein HanHA89_Chr02g0056871 [Helianthus annuus]KAJ0777186.1 hypothetical protein HanLR1_Chr02g0054491 [Helianthus annuus]